jgi:voltage-gated potassium channel
MSSERTVWVRLDAKLKYLAPVFLLLLVIYLYSSLVSPVLSKRILGYVEIAVITYFVSELVVKYVISNSYRQFLRDYWFDIVLLVPFFSSLRLLGAAGKVLKSIKPLRYTKYIQKIVKVPGMIRKSRFFTDKSENESNRENK